LHAIQDFYAHTNWVEHYLDTASKDIPLWKGFPDKNGWINSRDGRDADEREWLLSGVYPGKGKGSPHGRYGKDSAKSGPGSTGVTEGPNKGSTYFAIAMELAKRQTAVEWGQIKAAAPSLMGRCIKAKFEK